MNQTLILGLLRHALQLGAGYAVARGLWKDGDSETLIGAVLSLVSFGWMVIDQRRAAKQATVAQAVQAMAAATKGLADATQVAAIAAPGRELLEAAANVPGARAAIDRASALVLGGVRS